MEQAFRRGEGGASLSSVSLDLFGKIYDGTLPGCVVGDAKTRLIDTLRLDLENWVCLSEGSARDKIVSEWINAIAEVEGLADATCEVLYSVSCLAQNDPVAMRNPDDLKQKWFDFLQRQDVSTYGAPILIKDVRTYYDVHDRPKNLIEKELSPPYF